MHVVDVVPIKEIARRTGLARNTVRAALRSEKPPSYGRAPRPSKLDPFKEEIERLLRGEPRIPNTRIRELIGELEAELRRLGFVPLIVVDEVGYIPFDPEAANRMFSLASARYERASLVVTSNKPSRPGVRSSATGWSPRR